jgi:hypothetical protein
MPAMKLYHEQPGVQLYLGDCREVAASIDMGAVGLVLADPPYGTGVQKTDGSIGRSAPDLAPIRLHVPAMTSRSTRRGSWRSGARSSSGARTTMPTSCRPLQAG